MTPDALLALAGFALVSSWTPGPNNAMLAASGANFGLRRTLPHLAGVTLGFAGMVLAVALGLGATVARAPALGEVLRWAGAALLLWFAWRIATAARAGAAGRGRPLSFAEAAAFQWVNPKAWTMVAGALAQFGAAAAEPAIALAIAGTFLAAGLTSALGWTAFGAALQGLLAHGSRLRLFNAAMGALLAALVLMMLAG